jgi:hypothetical protein
MPYVSVALPYRGINVDSAYSALPSGFTVDALNVVPYDAFKGKLRLGQRRPLLGAFEFNDTSPAVTREVQAIIRADAFVGGVLKQRCFVISGGEVWKIDPGENSATKLTQSLTRKIKATGYVGTAVFGQYLYITDGLCYRKVDITVATPSVVAWNGPEGHIRASGATTNGNNETGNRAPLLCKFGGRLVLAGIPESPNVWFMSKINDPEDWSATASGAGGNAHNAIAGSSSEDFGIPGEPIVALIPVGESGLMFATRHGLTYLTADPVVDGARMIEMSRSVGIISERAWCSSDSQVIYLMAQDGMYRIVPNEFQVTKSGRVTSGRLDSYFQQQDFDSLNCVLGYDAEAQNVHVMLSRTDLPDSSVHLLYNQPTDSFWPIQTGWAMFRAPTCAGEFPLGDARAPILAFGSAQGYIAWFDRDLTSGVDGQSATGYKSLGLTVTNAQAATQRINSNLIFGPVVQPNLAEVMMKDIRIELSMDISQDDPAFSTPIDRLTGPFLSIRSGETAEDAIGQSLVSVNVVEDMDAPAFSLDGGGTADFTSDPVAGYTGGVQPSSGNPSFTSALDLFYETPIAGTYSTSDTLIQDPGARTYTKGQNRVYNTDPGAVDWRIQHLNPADYNMYRRDETYPDTTPQSPSGTYTYYSPESYALTPLPLPTLPTNKVAPRYKIGGAVYSSTVITSFDDELVPGRNDSKRCRIRGQAAYVQIQSYGVPWALERMAVLIEPVSHTKNVKGTY